MHHYVISGNDITWEVGINQAFKSCSVVCFNAEKILALKNQLPGADLLRTFAQQCKAMGHPARLAILHVLSIEDCCVCDVAEVLGKPVSTVSQHLRLLMSEGLLDHRQEGKLVIYTLTDDGRAAVQHFFPSAPATVEARS
jgi:DNA-binding transcriptional ArsR family regulator